MVRQQIKRWSLLLLAAAFTLGLSALGAEAPTAMASGQEVGGQATESTILIRVTKNASGDFLARAYAGKSQSRELGVAELSLDREINLSPLCPFPPIYRYGDAALAGLELRIWEDAYDADRHWYSIRPTDGDWLVAGTKQLAFGPAIDGDRSVEFLFALKATS